VEAGACAIITQLFYDSQHFISFVKRAREAGIAVPILPGLLPIVSYPGLQRIVQLCKTYLPPDVKAATEELKDDTEGLKMYGIELTTKLIKEIIAANIGVNHFHFYTLNNTFSTMQVLKNFGWYKE
jgi:methylenetetrahydrofolate reductase (NADPH)